MEHSLFKRFQKSKKVEYVHVYVYMEHSVIKGVLEAFLADVIRKYRTICNRFLM
jgi:hypothetical protein